MDKMKEKTIINFRKTRSLLAKIIKMVESHDYCIDIMQQNLAAIGLLRSAHQMLMENHLNTCFKKAMSSQNQQRQQKMIQALREDEK